MDVLPVFCGFAEVVTKVTTFLWNNILIYLLLGTGLFYTVKLGLPQIRYFVPAFKHTFHGIFKKNSEGVSSFQALATAVAAQIGTGNIGGVATAIVSGGPGAVFWMWISGILGMSTIFAEAILAQKFKQHKDGKTYGGPAYYLRDGLKNKKLGKILSIVFACSVLLAMLFTGKMVQSNSISVAMKQSFNIPPLVSGIAIAALASLIFIGGIKRIAKFAEMVVPFMAVAYLIASIVIMIKFSDRIAEVFSMIFNAAFSAKAVAGGFAGIAVKKAIRFGIARGLFSNEAGMGSTPHAHAVANVNYPAQQGFTAMGGVIIDTIFVCTATAIIILITDVHKSFPDLTTVALTQKGFETAFGPLGNKFLSLCLLFFAFTTTIGWYYFGESNINFLFGKKGLWPFRLVVIIAIILGAVSTPDLVWTLADLFNGIMVIPNVIGLVLMSSIVTKEKNIYNGLSQREKYEKG